MTVKNRNIAEEILEGIQAIKAGQGKHYYRAEVRDIGAIRQNLYVSQSVFAALLGVSLRTLQEWEQNRREPSGPAKRLLEIARLHPEVLLEGRRA